MLQITDMEKKTWQILGGLAALALGVHLYSKYNKKKSTDSHSENTVDVKDSDYSDVIGYGSKGDDVLALQKYLNTVSKYKVPETGDFDDITLKVTKEVLNTEYVDLPTMKRINRDLKTAKII